MAYNLSTIKEKLERAVSALFENQPDIFEFTSETGQTEWNLTHHLANEVSKFFPGLSHDLDVIKVNLDNKRPDIIFHKRGTHRRNFLVIEVKRDGRPAEIESDIQKIKDYWFGGNLKYNFGAAINLKHNKTFTVKVFENHKTPN